MHIVFTTLMVAALGLVLVLLGLTVGLNNAIILVPALLAIAITVHHELSENAAALSDT